jgi:pimeloyl-ACP methyl ester carboxylesterase
LMNDPQRMFEEMADACMSVARELGFERFHLLGWNGGTQIALRALIDHEARIRSCILIDPIFELAHMRHVGRAVEFKRILFAHPGRAWRWPRRSTVRCIAPN